MPIKQSDLLEQVKLTDIPVVGKPEFLTKDRAYAEAKRYLAAHPEFANATEALRANMQEHSDLDELIKIQGTDGNWNYDEYMYGLLNGLIVANAVVDDKDAVFPEAPEFFIRDMELGKVAEATKKPMYVWRDVLNPQDILDWAKAQGFKACVPADELHVTIVYSKAPVDITKAGDSFDLLWIQDGERTVEPLGSEGAVVLKFSSPELQNRWTEFREVGASWDFEGYQPHVTITYAVETDFDTTKIEPYRGVIELGPEQNEPLNEDWKDGLIEESKAITEAGTYFYRPDNETSFQTAVEKIASKLGMPPSDVAYHYTLDPKYFQSANSNPDGFADAEFALGITDAYPYADQKELIQKVYGLSDDELSQIIATEAWWQNNQAAAT